MLDRTPRKLSESDYIEVLEQAPMGSNGNPISGHIKVMGKSLEMQQRTTLLVSMD